jgi:ABC-type amino acid transport substrate-binding protein
VAEQSPSQNESILAEIRHEGVLKVAMRRDAAPLGYLDAEGIWTGYCTDLAESLASELSKKFNRSQDIEVVRLVSTLDNRFEWVKEGDAHLECGPNTIRDDIDGITFSNAFFVAGARFVVPLEQGEVLDSNGAMAAPVSVRSIAESKVGVLRNTTTELFLAENYPRAKTVYFQGATGGAEALQALIKGEIESFISDDILIEGEIARQNLSRDNFILLPEQPLTCEFYGLILPEGNREWDLFVNAFIRETALDLSRKWLTEFSGEDVLTSFNRCLNQ